MTSLRNLSICLCGTKPRSCSWRSKFLPMWMQWCGFNPRFFVKKEFVFSFNFLYVMITSLCRIQSQTKFFFICLISTKSCACFPGSPKEAYSCQFGYWNRPIGTGRGRCTWRVDVRQLATYGTACLTIRSFSAFPAFRNLRY